MNRPNITITKIRRCTLVLALAAGLLALAAPALAHGGFDHVRGTVSKVDNNVLTVKTAKGDVDVKLNAQTEISKGNQKAAVEDLKPGSRVVVDIPEGSKDPIAHSVQIGVASAPTHHAPEHK